MSFKCSYCGKEFETPVERARCEIACEAEQKRKAEQERVKKLQGEKLDRCNEIQEDIKKLNQKIVSYNKDYNEPVVVDYEAFPNVFNYLRSWF